MNFAEYKMNFAEYSENQFLGSGSFSNVYKITVNHQTFALKKIHPYLLKDPSIKNALIKQIAIMKNLNHPNIIKYFDTLQINDNELNIVLEYAEGGNLFNQLKIYQKLSESQTIRYIKDISSAIKYLHQRSQPVLHRDIKPQNILLTKNGTCKLADFGCSNTLDEQRYTFAGTKEYMAPQILRNQPYGKQVDLWCLGVLICELVTGKLPKYQNKRLLLPPNLSRPAEDVIKKLLDPNPSLRMTLSELQQHIWLSDRHSASTYPSLQYQQFQQLSSSKMKKNINERLLNIKASKEKSNCFLSKCQINKQPLYELSEEKVHGDEKMEEISSKTIEILQYLADLKIKVKHEMDGIIYRIEDYENSKILKINEIYRLSQKLKQYDSNIDTLVRKYPLKFPYEYQETAKDFLKKIDHLQQYVEYFPTKLSEQVLDIPEINISKQKSVAIDEDILKLKTYMLFCQRDALGELITAKKKHQTLQMLNN